MDFISRLKQKIKSFIFNENGIEVEGWKYYNHAAIPTCAPHEMPNLKPLQDGSIWKMKGRPLFARYTTDYDCGYDTGWWYTIQDKPFDINKLNAKKRYRITKGLRYFYYKRIDPSEYAERMAYIALEDFKTYPKKYRPRYSLKSLVSHYITLAYTVLGVFDKQNNLVAFGVIDITNTTIYMIQFKCLPEYEKLNVNAVLVYSLIETFRTDVAKNKYITNGQRNTLHETNFNDDLVKHYGFRRVYCKLFLQYNPIVKPFFCYVIYFAKF